MYTYKDNLVSLITPGWNGKQFVHRLLDSILEQTYRPIEYIYVDDGSTDGTADIVQSYKDKFEKANIYFKFIRQENGGISKALMTGFQHVTGEYMSCPEYDDILLPNSVKEKIKYLEDHPDVAVVTAEAWIVNEDNIEKRERLISNKNPNRFDRNHFHQALMGHSIFNAACHMIRMEFFDKTHPNRMIFPSRHLPNQQILLPLYYHYNRGFIEQPLSICVARNNSLSRSFPTLQSKIDITEEYKTILIKTISSINMPQSDIDFYKKRVEINVHKDYLLIGFNHKCKDLFMNSFHFLEQEHELNNTHYRHKELLNSEYKYQLYRFKIVFTNFFYRITHLFTK